MTRPPSYGDVTAEYVALHSSAAFVENVYDVVDVFGPDAVAFLDGLLSQDMTALEAGMARRSFLLQPQGKLTALLWVARTDSGVRILTDAGFGGAVIEQLTRFRLRVDAAIEPGGRAHLVAGPSADPSLAAEATLLSDVPPIRRYVTVSSDLDLPRAGSLAYDALRVEMGEPVMGVDVDEKTIPQETGLVAEAVSFTKGCYLGQELVARIDSRGHVNRRLVALALSEPVLPPAGATVKAGDKEVGLLTSPSESLELRAPVGLSLIRREVGAGDEVIVDWEGGSARARVREVPVFTDS